MSMDQQPGPNTQRLTLSESRNALIVPLGLTLVFFALGYAGLTSGHRVQGGVFLLFALARLTSNFALWKRYRQVKRGDPIYVDVPLPSTVPPPLPQAVSAMFVSILTCLVGLCSLLVITSALSSHNHLTDWVIAGLLLIMLWGIDGYCWYRVFTDKHSVKPMTIQEQTEGVLPLLTNTTRATTNQEKTQ